MTKEQREKKNQDQGSKTKRPGGIGRTAGAAIAVAGVSLALVATTYEPSRGEGTLMPFQSISEQLEAAGASDTTMLLTKEDGEIDLLYTGAPGCSHCQAFMEGEFGELLDFAQNHELDFVYMPAAMSSYDVALAAVEVCAAPTTTMPAGRVLQEVYQTAQPLRDAVKQVRDEVGKETKPNSEAMTPVWDVLADLHERTGSQTPMDKGCYEAEVEKTSRVMNTFAEKFDLVATPSFYILSDQGVIRVVGEPDLDQLAEMITK